MTETATFMHPMALWLLIGAAILFIAESTAAAPGSLRISTGETLSAIASYRSTYRWIPPLLRALALACLIVALARPLQGMRVIPNTADVVDIQLCVDVSRSMQVTDLDLSEKKLDRLEITKFAVRDFLQSRKQRIEDRFGNDRVGLILYAGYAWTQCPLTLDYAVLERELENARIVDRRDRDKDGTAIGSAIGLAVSKLRKSEAESKVIVLLTDGRNNAGNLEPMTAAQFAKDFNIRIYTIAAGSDEEVEISQDSWMGPVADRIRLPVDTEGLQRIAEVTGGKFYTARNLESLKEAYEAINSLETTEVEGGHYYEYEEGFEPWVAGGIALFIASIVMRRLWFESIP
ncbi:MAG: VWA domain-containing protein [Candidatus Hydrogenedentota bacterium]